MKILTKEEVQKRLIVHHEDYKTMYRFFEIRLLNFIGTDYQNSCVNYYIKMLKAEIKLKSK